MYELFCAFFQFFIYFSLKPLTRNHSYIMVYYVFFNRSGMTTVPLGTFNFSSGSMPVMSSPAPQRQRCLLPHWCIYLAYTLCLLLSIFCIVLVILYGHKFGTAKALKWLVALLISFVQSFFITEPLKVWSNKLAFGNILPKNSNKIFI